MKNTICAVLSFLFIVSAVFGGGGRDLDADAYRDLDEVVMVSSGGGMNIESYMGMLLMFADELELTDEQREKIIDIEVEYGDGMKGLMLEIRQIDLDIDKTLYEKTALEEVRPLLERKSRLYGEVEWLELVQWDAEMKVLTEEQGRNGRCSNGITGFSHPGTGCTMRLSISMVKPEDKDSAAPNPG